MNICDTFDGCTSVISTHKTVEKLADQAMWFSSFLHVEYVERPFMEHLLELHKLNWCCHITGPFAIYTAGVFSSWRVVTLFVVDNSVPYLDLLRKERQRGFEFYSSPSGLLNLIWHGLNL